MARGASCFLLLLVAGCATRAANVLPEPRVALLDSIPARADVELTCGGETRHATTPVRVAVPAGDDSCTLVLSKQGFRPVQARFDSHFVITRGRALRADERHELDSSRVTSPADLLTLPLQRWADRVQNALQRKVMADYEITVELSR